MAKDFDVPFSGSIPMDSEMVSAADLGRPFYNSNPATSTPQSGQPDFTILLAAIL